MGEKLSMLISADRSTLVVIDSQKRLMPAIHNHELVMSQCIRLANIATLLHIPIIGTEQNSQSLGQNLDSIRSFCSTTISKVHFNACEDGLIHQLDNLRNQVILIGCEAHICVLQTAFGLLNENLEVFVVEDCIGSRESRQITSACNRMHSAGISIATLEMVAVEWLRSSKTSRFKDILNIVK